MMKNCFVLSQYILAFLRYLNSCRDFFAKWETGELGLTSKFEASQLRKQTIAPHILSKISGSKDSQTINFGKYLVRK